MNKLEEVIRALELIDASMKQEFMNNGNTKAGEWTKALKPIVDTLKAELPQT